MWSGRVTDAKLIRMEEGQTSRTYDCFQVVSSHVSILQISNPQKSMKFWGAVEFLETLEGPRLTWKSVPRTVRGTSALSKYVSVCVVAEKLNFSWQLMGSEFIGT